MTAGSRASVAVGKQYQDRHWALFVDWCTATGQQPLPATAATILAFLGELPAGAATARRRLFAIDLAHRHAGYPPPSADPHFDALLRPPRPPRFDPALVGAALAAIPIGGWPAGLVGRRDAALVALVCSAGFTRRQIQALRTPAVPADPGEPQPGVAWTTSPPAVSRSEHPGVCPACALTRWQTVAFTTATSGWRTVRNHLADLGEDTAAGATSHDCTRPAAGLLLIDNDPGAPTQAVRESDGPELVPLFWAIDRHGAPQTGYPLSTRTITSIVAAHLAAATHTNLRYSVAGAYDPRPPATWSGEDHGRVIAARRAAIDRLASFEADLDEADAYAEAILQRVDADWRADA